VSTPEDKAACLARGADGYPVMLQASPGAAIHIGGDCKPTQASGASIVWKEQAQKYLVPLIVLLVLVLFANGVVMGLNLSRQTSIEQALRSDQISQDLRKYETQQLRVQSALNAELQKLILQQGCKR
jgi:hypothetical protein